MLIVNVPLSSNEYFNEETNTFEVGETFALRLEHSLVSASKWESIFEKPFLTSDEKTPEEILGYIKAMTLEEVPEDIYEKLSVDNIKEINSYIDAKMTATWFKAQTSKRPKEIITTEIIYYWMVSLNIPFECQYWHLNRLMTFIQVINQKNAPQKKMTPQEIAARNRTLNEQRLAQLKTSG